MRLACGGAVVLFAALSLAACSDRGTDSGAGSANGRSTVTAAAAPPASTVAGLLRLGRPVILAHAAGEDVAPHSTPYGYARAVAEGVDILDFDVQLSKDGVLVVQHDDTVDRTTEATGRVADMTYAQLAELDNGYWFTKACTCKGQPTADYVFRGIRTGTRPPPKGFHPDDFIIPRFEDVARRYPRFVLNVEIKGTFPDAVPAARELARILTTLHREDAAVVTSFDDKVAEAFHEMAPTVAITPGLSATSAYIQQGVNPPPERRILQIPPSYESFHVLTPELIARSKADGLVLWIWPNDRSWENPAGYRRLLDMGVGGINASDPGAAVRTLRAWLGTHPSSS
jgi:glycerophosphoryl diester phosphodiesterase